MENDNNLCLRDNEVDLWSRVYAAAYAVCLVDRDGDGDPTWRAGEPGAEAGHAADEAVRAFRMRRP